jgi:molybdate transport system substrate-binding protein
MAAMQSPAFNSPRPLTGISSMATRQLLAELTAAYAKHSGQALAIESVGSLVAKGEVALGFQQLSELIHVDGIAIVGPLPPAIQITTTFSAAITTGCTRPAAAQALMDFMASPEATPAKLRQGMEPVCYVFDSNSRLFGGG